MGRSSLLAVAAKLELDSVSPPPDTIEEETTRKILSDNDLRRAESR
jgi:hypothetical protein